MKFGLKEQEITQICDIFRLYPEVKQVKVFGSRATGDYRETSDIDLVIMDDVSIDIVAKIKYQLEESTTVPYFFDVLAYNKIKNLALKNLINQEGRVFFESAA
ncbi:MAG: nucleotidyltransferase domain-containing protein [Gammaproteobacteria bacterium]|nr:nucleotidyltransferase domain-containing protein [Gammaproteobacteria bacterium]